MPEDLDLSTLKSSGLQPSEILMPEEELEKVEVFVNDEVVAQLSEMGFSREGCKRAVHETKNSGVDAAMAWVMEHMGDPDFNEPFIIPGSIGVFRAGALHPPCNFAPTLRGVEMKIVFLHR